MTWSQPIREPLHPDLSDWFIRMVMWLKLVQSESLLVGQIVQL